MTPFDPAQIENECFGGVTVKHTTWQGVTNTVEHEKLANALMLFYEKARGARSRSFRRDRTLSIPSSSLARRLRDTRP